MDIIYLHGIKLETVIGVWNWERQIKQRLALDIDLGTDTQAAGQSDELTDTVNYHAVAASIRETAGSRQFELVEALAEAIVARVFDDFPVTWVRLKINKQGAVRGVRNVGIVIERTRA